MHVSSEIDFSNVKTSCFLKDTQIYMQGGYKIRRWNGVLFR